ncbi:hypothetical protein CK203_084692 [Vitis vinifera]|uniref:Uncharacterized protein n=1 Tax=Vitis vinifera TaxID=29760 RepID=A0A438ETS2_VITVI|nr:hypothetical protein CK203_084692 [Vitis vinifera]
MLGEQQSDQFETFAFIIHGGETFQLSDQRPGKGVIVLGVTTVGNEATQEDRCWNIQGKPLARRNPRPDCNSKAYHSESKNLDNQTATSPFTKE